VIAAASAARRQFLLRSIRGSKSYRQLSGGRLEHSAEEQKKKRLNKSYAAYIREAFGNGYRLSEKKLEQAALRHFLQSRASRSRADARKDPHLPTPRTILRYSPTIQRSVGSGPNTGTMRLGLRCPRGTQQRSLYSGIRRKLFTLLQANVRDRPWRGKMRIFAGVSS